MLLLSDSQRTYSGTLQLKQPHHVVYKPMSDWMKSFTFFPFFLRWADFPVAFSLTSSLISAAMTMCVRASQTAVCMTPKKASLFFFYNPAWMSGKDWSGGCSHCAQRPTRSAAHTHFYTLTHAHTHMHTHTHALCLLGEEPVRLPSSSDGGTHILALSSCVWVCISFLFSCTYTHTHFTSTCPWLWLCADTLNKWEETATSYWGLSLNSNQYQLILSCVGREIDIKKYAFS